MAFDSTADEEIANQLQSVETYERYYDIGRKVLYGVLILVALLYVRKTFKKLGRALAKASTGPDGAAPANAQSGLADLPAQTQRIRASDVFGERARGRPEEVAKIIKTMMSE
jgi:flagellar biosynthesis/type III secretory pathway M-ring protein FliF/YscJ